MHYNLDPVQVTALSFPSYVLEKETITPETIIRGLHAYYFDEPGDTPTRTGSNALSDRLHSFAVSRPTSPINMTELAALGTIQTAHHLEPLFDSWQPSLCALKIVIGLARHEAEIQPRVDNWMKVSRAATIFVTELMRTADHAPTSNRRKSLRRLGNMLLSPTRSSSLDPFAYMDSTYAGQVTDALRQYAI